MDSLAKTYKQKLTYPSQIETPLSKEDTTKMIINMLGFSPKVDESKFLSPRQLDMLNYHHSIELPSFYDRMKSNEITNINSTDEITFSITDIQ